MSAPSAPATVLFIGINPMDTPRLRLDGEAKSIRMALERSRQSVTLIVEGAATDEELRRSLLRHVPSVLHLSGHGPEESATGGFTVEDSNGMARVLEKEAFADLLKLCRGRLQCVVLNGCYSENLARAVGQHIPYVVGMSDSIGDDAADKFSTGFYDALSHGGTFEEAFALGRNAIDLAGIPESLVPVLIKQPGARPQRLLTGDVSPTSAGLASAGEQALIEFLATEYGTSKSARLLWSEAGGRPGQVDTESEDAIDLWRSLWRKARNGALPPVALLEAALKKYPESALLRECLSLLSGN